VRERETEREREREREREIKRKRKRKRETGRERRRVVWSGGVASHGWAFLIYLHYYTNYYFLLRSPATRQAHCWVCHY
jgi:hypothetical protein